MADNDNKNPNKEPPGEKREGKYHYNPGNQSGKVAEVLVPEAERVNNRDVPANAEKPRHR
jgi:hypothetical protein